MKMYAEKHMEVLQSTLIIQAYILKDVKYIRHYINTIVKDYPFAFWLMGENSEKLGVKTTIATYENKRGVSHLAHYTYNGDYYGKCSELGDEPIYYKGNFAYGDFKDKCDIVLPPKPADKSLIERMDINEFIVLKKTTTEDAEEEEDEEEEDEEEEDEEETD